MQYGPRPRSQWSGLRKPAPGEEEGWRQSLANRALWFSLSLFLSSQSVCLSAPSPHCSLSVSLSLSPLLCLSPGGKGPSFSAVRRHWGRKLPRSTFLLGVYTPRQLLLHNPCQACGLTGRLRTFLFGLKGQGHNDLGNPS